MCVYVCYDLCVCVYVCVQSRFPYGEDCNLLVMTSGHVIVCQEKELHCFSVDGEPIRYVQ